MKAKTAVVAGVAPGTIRSTRRRAAPLGAWLTASVAASLWLAPAALAQVDFSPTHFAAGDAPLSVAVGDLNGDGNPELATANFASDNVSVLLGAGNGSFGAASNFGAGDRPASVAIGDLNGDGNPDLAAANSEFFSSSVSVLLGAGNGSFGAAVDFDTGDGPLSVAIGDLNGDGNLDLVTANRSSGTFPEEPNVSVLLGAGDGSFGAAANFRTGGGPAAVAIGDLNGDGKPDLAVANAASNSVSVLLGAGDGSFGAPADSPVEFFPTSVAIGDLNGDGKPDLAVANRSAASVSVLLGAGDGSFGAATNLGTGPSPSSVAIGDLNGDGNPDFAVANEASDDVSVLLGAGNGSFGTASNFGAGDGPASVAISDLNGDGKRDLAIANGGSDNVSVLLNTPDSDGDGIPDDEDVETIQDAIEDLPRTAFTGGGHAASINAILDEVEALVASGDIQTALKKLGNLRRRVDGCGSTADNNDWIVDCDAQVEIRGLIDMLSSNLST